MTQRHLGFLLIASVVVLALAAWVVHRGQPAASAAGRPVLPGLRTALNSVTEVRLSAAGGALTRIERGAKRWIVRERGYPADSGKLRKLLIDLGDLKIIERKTRLASNYPILGVQNPASAKATGTRIDIITPARTWSLIVGHAADGNDCYVRVPGRRQSLLASPLVRLDAKPAQWLDPIIVDLHRAQVSRIDEQPARGPRFSLARAKATDAHFTVQGIPRGRRLQSAGTADDMASALSNLTLSDVRKATAAPKGVRLSRAVFRTFGGLEIEIEAYPGGKHGQHDIVVVAHGSGRQAGAEAARINARVHGWVYRIPGYRYQEIFQPLSALLAPLPTRHGAKPHRKAA